MAYDLQEQEQIDSMKAFWQQWGKLISGAVVAISVAYLGYKAFGYYQNAQASKAAVVFADVEQAAQSQDLAKVKGAAGLLQSDYAGTAYAADAALLAAKVAFEKNDLATAQAQLSWVVQNVKDESMVAVAHLRLATMSSTKSVMMQRLPNWARRIQVHLMRCSSIKRVTCMQPRATRPRRVMLIRPPWPNW